MTKNIFDFFRNKYGQIIIFLNLYMVPCMIMYGGTEAVFLDSGRRFEILAERSEFRPHARKNENQKFDERLKMGFQNFSLKQKLYFEYEY